MNSKSLLTRTAVVVPAAALMIAAVPGLASAKSKTVKVKNGTYKGSILGNSGDEGGDYRTPMTLTVSKSKVTKLVLQSFPLWAVPQPAGVSTGNVEPSACQQAGTAPGTGYSPTITVQFSTMQGSAVTISKKGSFSAKGAYGTGVVGSPIESVTYAEGSNPASPAGATQLAINGKFSSSKKASGKLSGLTIQLGAGVEKFTCSAFWNAGQSTDWGIPKAPK